MLASRRKAAGFPTGKTFAAWDPAVSSIPAPTQQALRTLEWVHRRENLVVCGPSGPGDRFFSKPSASRTSRWSMAAGVVCKTPAAWVVRRLAGMDMVTKAVADDLRAELVVILRHRPSPRPTTPPEGLYRIVDAAYEKRSIALSSNLHPAGFDELMPKTLATATVDRLLHHAHICQTSGDSIRLTQALDGKE